MRQNVKWLAITVLISSPAFAQEVFDVYMDGQQVPVATAFTGSGTVTLNVAETQITVSLTHDIPSANVTDGHIHLGAAGVNGGIVFDFMGAAQSPINLVFNISPAQVNTLRSAGYYVNIHTFAFPSGEIRGQILPRVDGDQDTLSDFAESNTGIFVSRADTGTDPNNIDSDGDGLIDGVEVQYGSDPNDSGSIAAVPAGTLAVLAACVFVLLAGYVLVLYRRKSRSQ
jgi:hypothetical protein